MISLFCLFLVRKTYANDQITLNLTSTQFCAGTSISVAYTTTLPSSTLHKIQLMRDGQVLASNEAMSNPIDLVLPGYLSKGSNYFLQISALGVHSASVEVSINNMQKSIIAESNGYPILVSRNFCANTEGIIEGTMFTYVDNNIKKEIDITYQ